MKKAVSSFLIVWSFSIAPEIELLFFLAFSDLVIKSPFGNTRTMGNEIWLPIGTGFLLVFSIVLFDKSIEPIE